MQRGWEAASRHNCRRKAAPRQCSNKFDTALGLHFLCRRKAAPRQCSYKFDTALGLHFLSRQKLFPMRADEVGTNHPIFSFSDSPFLRHRMLHNGSFCQFIGKPMAVTSTEGYVARRLFNLVLNASPLPIASSQYAIQQVMAYSLLPSMPVAFIQAPLMVAPI